MSCESTTTDFDFCTNLLIMSFSSNVDVQETKSADTPVIWREYEALRDHLTRNFKSQHDALDTSVQNVDLKLAETDGTVNEIQGQVADLQTKMEALTDSVNAIREALEQRHQDGFDDADSVNEDDGAALGHAPGRGRGHAGRGRGFAPLGPRHVPVQPQPEDPLGKPRFSIPSFDGQGDVEDYLTCELKIEKLWCLHDYTEDRKVKLASSEFDGYALDRKSVV